MKKQYSPLATSSNLSSFCGCSSLQGFEVLVVVEVVVVVVELVVVVVVVEDEEVPVVWWHWHGRVSMSPLEPCPVRPDGRQGSMLFTSKPWPASSRHSRVLIWSYCGEHGEQGDHGLQSPQPTLRFARWWEASMTTVEDSCMPPVVVVVVVVVDGGGVLDEGRVSTKTSVNLMDVISTEYCPNHSCPWRLWSPRRKTVPSFWAAATSAVLSTSWARTRREPSDKEMTWLWLYSWAQTDAWNNMSSWKGRKKNWVNNTHIYYDSYNETWWNSKLTTFY